MLGGYIRDAISRFEETEGAGLPGRTSAARPSLAAVGSVARKALSSALLRDRLVEKDVEPAAYVPYDGLEALLGSRDWSLALVLSPHKRAVVERCDALTASARRSGVVDTVVQSASGDRVGVNTNVVGASWAIRHLMGNEIPRRCLIAGTGASARSCAVGLHDLYGDVRIGMVGRNPARTRNIAEEFSASVEEDIGAYSPDLVINATTVGETADEKPHFPLEEAFVAGARYFDLNNRTSALQIQAMERGCVSISGILMQTVVNAIRVHLLARS